MNIGIVGGLDRQAPRLIDIGEAAGHRVQCHTGTLTGASATELRNLVDRSDLVVIVTGLNSHGAVQMARRLARRSNRPARLIHRMGATQFAALVQGLASARPANEVTAPPKH